MPQHTHGWQASNDSALTGNDGFNPAGHVLAQAPATDPLYVTPTSPLAALASGVVSNTGGGQAHENMQPYLVVDFCIALQGLFPSRN